MVPPIRVRVRVRVRFHEVADGTFKEVAGYEEGFILHVGLGLGLGLGLGYVECVILHVTLDFLYQTTVIVKDVVDPVVFDCERDTLMMHPMVIQLRRELLLHLEELTLVLGEA